MWTSPVADSTESAAWADTFGDLQYMLGEAGSDSELLTELQRDIGELIRRLPHELRDTSEDEVFLAAAAGDFAGLVERVTPYLNARLTVGGS